MRLRGATGDIKAASESALSIAAAMGVTAIASQIPAPSSEIRAISTSPNTINALLNSREQLLPTDRARPDANHTPHMNNIPPAIGILETHGYTALLHATDRMVKAANVSVVTKEKIGAGLVTIIVQGDVAAVTAAIEAGKESVGSLGKVIAAHIIARPHEDVLALIGR